MVSTIKKSDKIQFDLDLNLYDSNSVNRNIRKFQI